MNAAAACEAYGRAGAAIGHTLADCFDLAGFLAMGGHGLYVWLSYGVALAVVLWLVVSVRLGERRLIRSQRAEALRHASYRAAQTLELDDGVAMGSPAGPQRRPTSVQGER